MELEFRVSDAAVPPASDVIAATLAEGAVVTGSMLPSGPPATPADFALPGGVYIVGFVGALAVCGGGVKALEDGVAELKRMYVVPLFRRRGVGRALLLALEASARELGYRTLRFDCHSAVWPMYAASGYREIADYNGHPHAEHWGEKLL